MWEIVDRVEGWIRVPEDEFTGWLQDNAVVGDDPFGFAAELDPAAHDWVEVLDGEPGTTGLWNHVVERILATRSSFSEYYLGMVSRPNPSAGAAVLGASEGGRVAYIANCGQMYTRELNASVAAGPDPEVAPKEWLVEGIRDPGLLRRDERERPLQAWRRLGVFERNLDPRDAPPDVMDDVQLAEVAFIPPRSWVSSSVRVCPVTVGLGRNACATTDVLATTTFLVYTDGSDVEFYATSGRNDVGNAIREERRLVARVDGRALLEAAAGGDVLVLTIERGRLPSAFERSRGPLRSVETSVSSVPVAEVDELLSPIEAEPVPEGSP